MGGAVSCPGCANPSGGLLISGCRQCLLRDIAKGPHFQASMRAGKLTAAYRAQLAAVDPDPVKANAEVKAAAKTVFMGSTRA
mgnify:CR=1 FL=1